MLKQNQKIRKKWARQNAKRYSNLGYSPNKDGYFDLKVEDLNQYSTEKVILICDNCKNEYNAIYRTYITHQKNNIEDICDECIQRARSLDIYSKVYEKCTSLGYDLLTPMEAMLNFKSPIMYNCKKHGVIKSNVGSVIYGNLCQKCAVTQIVINYRTKTFSERMDALYNKCLQSSIQQGYTLITPKSEFTSSQGFIEYECPMHGIKSMTAGNMAMGRGCSDCAKEASRMRWAFSREEIEKQVSDCGGILINGSDYVNNHTKNLFITCPICHRPMVTSLILFTQHGGQVCSNCKGKMSLGEQKIEKYLKSRKYKYTKQKWFSDCRDKNPLPFDFYLDNEKIIIEFDGRQHYGETNHFSYTYEQTAHHDKIKDEYCRINNIKIIRIPYWKIESIDSILDTELPHKDIV